MINTGNKEELLRKYLLGAATREELVLLSRMMDDGSIHQNDIDAAANRCFIETDETLADASAQEGWEKFSVKMSGGSSGKVSGKRLLRLWSLAASAAVITLLVAIGGIAMYHNYNDARLFQFPIVYNESMLNETTLVTAQGDVLRTDSVKSSVEVSAKSLSLRFAGRETSSRVAGDSDMNHLKVPFGKTSHVILSDGTKVWLNAGASLAFPTSFSENKTREVYLTGEAYFDVETDLSNSFVVHTKELKFTVLGTSFDIDAGSGAEEVTSVLETGSLKVEEKEFLFSNEVILSPGQKSTYNLQSNDLSVAEVNTLEYTSWKDGYLLLNNHALSSIIEKLSRYYNINFVVDEKLAAQTSISGKLLLFSDFNTAIKVLSDLSGLKYELQERSVVLKK